MVQQHQVAVAHGLSFYETRDDIRAGLEAGELVHLEGNDDYEVADFVDPPYVHPAARLFVERTASLYREACGERLVVTSGVRAIEDQPGNAHALSVHPAGMAVDLRVSQQESCRAWLESKLMQLEEAGLLNGIREFRPPHYHVAVFPEAYSAFVQQQRAALERATSLHEEATEPGRLLGVLGILAILLTGAVLVAMRWRRPQAP